MFPHTTAKRKDKSVKCKSIIHKTRQKYNNNTGISVYIHMFPFFFF